MVANAGISMMKSFVDSQLPPLASQPASQLWLTSPLLATGEDLDRILSVNVRGTFLCYKYAGMQMIAQGRGGRIIGKLTVSLLWFALLTLVWPLSYRRMLRHRQARTGFPERLLCEQIRYSSIDSVSRCV